MLCLCATQLRFWFQTDLGRENSASYYRQGRQLLLTLFTMVTRWSRSTSNFYALIGQNLTGEFLRKICKASWILFTFVPTCDVFNSLFLLDVQNEIQLLSGVFCYSWLVGFWLRNTSLAKASRKSVFGWHHFRFSPCLIRNGWKVWSDTGFTWYLSGAASRMVSLSNYCISCLSFRSYLMKSSVVYAAI